MIWFVCSGTGGTGKSSFASALALAAAEKGRRVILLDCSGPSRCSDAYLGLAGKAILDLGDVLSGEASLNSVLYATRDPAIRYVLSSHESDVPAGEYSDMIMTLLSMCDVLIIDSDALSRLDETIFSKDDRIVLITRPDALSVRAAEMLYARFAPYPAEISLLLNQMAGDRKTRQRVCDTIEMVMGRSPEMIVENEPAYPCLTADLAQVHRAVRKAAFRLVFRWLS